MSQRSSRRTHRCANYTAEAMHKAYQSVRSGQYTGRRAAAEFHVPYGTLNKKLSGRAPVEAHGAGRPNEISAKNERKFVEYLLISGKYGYGYGRCEIKELVAEFVKEEDIKTRWADGKPGYEWLKNFLKRHPEINVRRDEHFIHRRLNGADPFTVHKFYDDLQALYDFEKKTLYDAHQIYNVAEIMFHHDVKKLSVLPSKCVKCNSKLLRGNRESDTSVLVCVRADGEKLHPLIAFQGRCVLPPHIPNRRFPGTAYYTTSTRKWMEGSLFSYWFESVFIPQIPDLQARSGRSVILFFDGNSLHISVRCLEVAVIHNVILVKLPPSLNCHLQPLDRTCLSALESAWIARSTTWKNESLATTQKLFGQVLGMIWSQHFGKRIVRKAFRTTGIFPLNRKTFPESAFSQSALRRYVIKKQASAGKILRTFDNELLSEPVKVPFDAESSNHEKYTPGSSSSTPGKNNYPNLFRRFVFKKRTSSRIPDSDLTPKRQRHTYKFEETLITEITEIKQEFCEDE